MGEPAPGKPPTEKRPEDRLDSWKEIAEYLSRDVTTVQRWEKREGMPVHRHVHDRMGSVYGSRAELDAWIRSRNLRAAQETGNNGVALPEPPAQSSEAAAEMPPELAARRTGWRLILPLLATAIALAVVAALWLQRAERFWRNPLANARFQTITDFGGLEQAAAVSRDGHFVAFLSDRDGPMDVWVTQVGSGEFHNLTHGSAPDIANPSIRTLAFSPDGSLVTYWVRRQNKAGGNDINIWAVPTMGGEPRPYLEGVAEFDWSHNGARLAYHTPGPGDPLFISDGGLRSENRPIFTAPTGLHAHFPLWSPMQPLSILFRASHPINWTSGAFAPTVELPSGSHRTMGA